MKNVFKLALLCAIAFILFGCDDIFGSKSDDTPSTGGEITPNPGDEQESVDFDVTYSQDFTVDTGVTSSSYTTTYNRALPNGSSVYAVGGQDEENGKKRALIMSGFESPVGNKFQVFGIKGLGKIIINYATWTNSNEGVLGLFVNDKQVESIAYSDALSSSSDLTYVFTVEDSSATKFTLKSVVGEQGARIHIYDVTWTTTK